MKWTITIDGEVPIYTQIVRLVIMGICRKELLPGETLPPLRHLADALGVNLHTVRNAYQELTQRGYILQGERQRARISSLPLEKEGFPTPDQSQILSTLLADAINHGYSTEEILDFVQENLRTLTEQKG